MEEGGKRRGGRCGRLPNTSVTVFSLYVCVCVCVVIYRDAVGGGEYIEGAYSHTHTHSHTHTTQGPWTQ